MWAIPIGLSSAWFLAVTTPKCHLSDVHVQAVVSQEVPRFGTIVCFRLGTSREQCVVGGETTFEHVPTGTHHVTAAMNLTVSDPVTVQVGDCDPLPLAANARAAIAAARRRRDGMVLNVNWPRPGDTVRSSTLVLSTSVAYADRRVALVNGTVCVEIVGRSCLELSGDSEFVEIKMPFDSPRSLSLWVDAEHDGKLLRALPVDVWFDPRPQRRDLGIVLSPDDADQVLSSLTTCLVLCHWREDLSWLQYQPHPAVVYEKRDDGTRHATPRNTANEASAYLKFIVDYYDRLPEFAIFLHSHRYAYHQEDLLSILNDLVPTHYCNLNSVVWGNKEDPDRKLLYQDHRSWVEEFLGPLPPLLLDRCCAQFVVHRDRIRSRPLAFYDKALAVALAADERDTEANRQLGLLFEWLWRFIFGEDPVAPDAAFLIPNLNHTDIVYMDRRPPCLTMVKHVSYYNT